MFDPSHSGPTSRRPGDDLGGIADVVRVTGGAGGAGVIALLLASLAAPAMAQAPAAATPSATPGSVGEQHEVETRPGEAPGGTRLIDQETMEAAAAGKKIGTVHIVTENIFDPSRPGERRGVFRLVNRLHRTTRPEVIQHQLLFQPGDTYSPETLRESERLLRGNRYLYEATIRTVAEDERKVDLEVLTRDVWTLQLGLDFRRAGGANSTAFDVEDENFFGTGKDIEVARLENVDRTSKLVRYRDPSLGNTHGIVDFTFADNSDGDTRALDVERPFYALDTRWALGVTALHDVRIDPLYDGGDVVDRFRQRRDFLEVYGGLSPGLLDGVTQRFRLGFTYDRNLFAAAPGFTPPDAAAANRTLAYPWIGYELVEDGFVTVRDFEQIKRTEDLNLGRVLTARLGWSSPVFGGDRSRLVLTSGATDGWAFGPRQILLVRANLLGRLSGGKIENGSVAAGVRYYVRTFGNGLLVAKATGDMAENLDFENQLLLGGDVGLRGYPLRYQAGDRRFLVSLEQRFYGSHEYFHLVTLGAAAFFDAGRAWFVEPPPSFLQLAGVQRQLLKDVGVGLRLGSSRSASGAVIHLDLAYPLDRNGSIKTLQYLVTTSQTF
ncbi:MAG TPA: POTRA domain-containing protein [Thermoanaerobaculia bacterium]|nr:POTRA domain-containing protein [Thermoanaerobaculia bacterium]